MTVNFSGVAVPKLLADFGGTNYDITNYVDYSAGFVINRGNSTIDPTGFVGDAGTFDATLRNLDLRFDPNNLAGPYVSAGTSLVVPGVPITFETVLTPPGSGSTTYTLFSGFADDWPQTYPDFGVNEQVALSATDGSSYLAQAQYKGSRGPEGSVARINAILTAIVPGFPDLLGGGVTTVGAFTLGTVAAMNHITDAVQAEWGDWFVAANGQLTFNGRDTKWNQASYNTSNGTFSDTAGGGAIVYSDVQMWRTPIINDITLIWSELGASVRLQAPASQAQPWGVQSLPNLTIPFASAIAAREYCQWILDRYAYPSTTFQSISFYPTRDGAGTAGWVQALSRELGDLITVVRTPKINGVATSPYTRLMWIRGINHTVDGSNWKTTYTLEDASYISNFFILDSSSLDGTNVLAF